MDRTVTAGLLVVLAVALGSVECCTPAKGFTFLSLEDMMARANLVLLGTDIQHIKVDDPYWGHLENSIFEVSCVLKNTHNITVHTNITLRRINPRTTCETSPPIVANKYIITVRPLLTYENTYEWDEVKKLHSAARTADDATVARVMQVCGFQTPHPPTGGPASSCPKPVHIDECTYYSGRGFVVLPSLALIFLMFLLQ